MTLANPHSSIRALWCLLAVLSVCGRSAFAQPPSPAPPGIPPPISASAQRVYEDARAQLLQVRTLLKGQDTQASVGSGFLVSDQGHIITNYHVVSQAALQPERYRLVFSTADRTEGPLQLLAFDAIHDLALVKPALPGAFAGRRPLLVSSASDADVAGRADLLAGQSARCGLCGDRGHLQRARGTQLLSDHLLCGLAEPRCQRRADAGPTGSGDGHQRGGADRWRAGELPGAGGVCRGPAGAWAHGHAAGPSRRIPSSRAS